ncbi:DUF362 domain-containing protein [Spirochaetota bacterium]
MQRVSLQKCEDYDLNILKNKIKDGMEMCGFDLGQLEHKRVCLKPNFLVASKPSKAIMTHPVFFRAVVQIVKEAGGIPVLIESPGIQSLKSVLNKTSFGDIVNDEAVVVAESSKRIKLHYENAKMHKYVDVMDSFEDVDIIINLPKFKSHGFAYYTGAIKNLFGAVPGMEKSKMHMKIPNRDLFCEYILDLNGALLSGFDKPKKFLHIMDAILVQEGEGPGPAGTPRKMDAIIIGGDAIAVDYVALSVSGLDINSAITVVRGFEREFWVNSPEEIEVVGDRIEDLKLHDFKPTRRTILSDQIRWPFTSMTFKNLFVEKPLPMEEKCTLCYNCKKICPANAIEKKNGKKKVPDFDYKKCIRCYCCMEICPEAALVKKRGKLQWITGT